MPTKTATKRKTGGKTASKRSSSKRSSPAKKAAAPRSPLPFAIGFGIGALIVILAVFGANGVVLGWLASFFKGAFGGGFFVIPVALGYCAWLYYADVPSRTRRVVSTLAFPVFIGATLHIFSADTAGMTAKALIDSGLLLKSGGLISGGFAALLSAAISRIGAGIVIFAGLLVSLFSAIDITPSMLYDYFFRRGDDDGGDDYDDGSDSEEDDLYEEDEPYPAVSRTPAKLFDFDRQDQKRPVDIPLDNEGMPVSEKPQFKIDKGVDQGLMDLDAPTSHTPEPLKAKPVPVAPAPKPPKPIEKSPKAADKPAEAPFMGEAVDLDAKKGYIFPPITLLEPDRDGPVKNEAVEETRRNSVRLVETLNSFGIDAKIINVTRGPSVTRYEVQTSRGTKYSKVTSLSDDIALALAAQSVRIAPIPDKVAIGIEVPNRAINIVHIRDVIEAQGFASAKSKVSFAMGRDIAGEAVIGDISKLPHLLVAGTTGSGKSVCINSILISILYKAQPDEVKFIMVDPKMIELGVYNGIPHLLIPVVTDPKKAAGALQWALGEMMKRYKKMKEAGVRNLADYNTWLAARHMANENLDEEALPQIVIVIDELADLMLVAANEVEEAICRLAQMARAAGMHLIIATQRPSADVITGIMKANIPSRIAFAVASQLESRIILDTMGAEKLIGRGDMLFNPIGSTKPVRVQGCFISSEEVEAVVGFVKENHEAEYSEDIIEQVERAAQQEMGGKKGGGSADDDGDADVMFYDAVQVIMDTGQASASMLQRRLKLGYARASRLIDQMEERGIIGAFEGSKPRQIILSKQDWMEMMARRD